MNLAPCLKIQLGCHLEENRITPLDYLRGPAPEYTCIPVSELPEKGGGEDCEENVGCWDH